MKKICVVTGTRAEYGLLKPLIKGINEDTDLTLQLIVTGMHLSPEFGLTYNEIIYDKFEVTEKIEILLSSDTSVGISKSMGLAMISFSELFERIKPDMIVVLGDRYEIFSVATVAMISKIPIAHLHGGETTEGAIDEAMRHSITKMSYLHFTSNEIYRNRVIQLGEEPSRVFNVGAIGEESIRTINFIDKKSLEEDLGIRFNKRIALLTFHPTTLESNSSEEQFNNLLEALDEINDLKIIFTKSNSDTNGRIVNKMIDEYVIKNPKRCVAFASLGQLRYLSAIGNSSSGIIEAPILGKPTVNIGDRQKGRIKTNSIVDCKPIKNEVIESIEKVLSKEFLYLLKKNINLKQEISISTQIVSTIKEYLINDKIILKKKFYDL